MWPHFGVKAEKGWMSVVRTDDRLDLVHAIAIPDQPPRISLCESYRIEGNDESAALSRLAKSHQLRRFRCSWVLSEGAYRLAQVESPAVPAEERLQAIRWRLKDIVDFPVDGAALAVTDIPVENGRQANVFGVIAPREHIAERMAACHKAGVRLEAIDIPEMAVRNVSALFEEPNRGLAFLLIDRDAGILVITFRGELYLSRRIEVALDGSLETRTQSLERLALELQRTLDNFDQQYGFISVARLMVAASVASEAVVEALSANLYVPVGNADLGRVFDCQAIPELRSPERQAQVLVAMGAALRDAA